MYLLSVHMWIHTESAKRRNPMQIHLITSFPWPAPMETMARVVPFMGKALHFAQRARALIPPRFTIRAFADETQGQVYMISFSLSLCCNVTCVAMALQHHCLSHWSIFYLFIFGLGLTWYENKRIRPLRKDMSGSFGNRSTQLLWQEVGLILTN